MLAHAAREGEQFSIDGPAVALTPKAAESLSLAFHELTTNAVKHGSLGMPGGQVNVSWTVEGKGGDKRLALVWEESGAADFTAAPGRNGFGMELLSRVLPYELDAGTTVEFGRDGFRFTLGMALDPARVREDKERGA
jgi:two-component system CheB/CheR fusion protein